LTRDSTIKPLQSLIAGASLSGGRDLQRSVRQHPQRRGQLRRVRKCVLWRLLRVQ